MGQVRLQVSAISSGIIIILAREIRERNTLGMVFREKEGCILCKLSVEGSGLLTRR